MKSILTELVIPPGSFERDGLRPGVLKKLPEVVAFTGPNGAGNTRLLERIRSNLAIRITHADIKSHVESLIRTSGLDAPWNPSVPLDAESFEEICKFGDHVGHPVKKQIGFREFWESRDGARYLLEGIVSTVERPRLVTLPSSQIGMVGLKDATPAHLQESLDMASRGIDEFTKIVGHTNRIIHHVTTTYYNATHPANNWPNNQVKLAVDRYRKMSELLELLVGCSPSIGADGLTTLFGRPLDDARLSIGQTRLIRFNKDL